MAQDQDFWPSCSYSYTYCMCQKIESYLALTTQQPITRQSYKVSQPNDASHLQQQGDCSFMNHQVLQAVNDQSNAP